MNPENKKYSCRHRIFPILIALLSGGLVLSPVADVLTIPIEAAAKKSQKVSAKKKRSKKTTSKKRNTKNSTKKTTKRRGVSSRWTNPVPSEVEQPSNDSLTLAVNTRLLDLIPADQNPGGLRVNKVETDAKSRLAKISLNDNFTYLPVTEELISQLSNEVSEALPDSIRNYRVSLNVGRHSLAYYITKVEPLPEKFCKPVPFVVDADPWIHPKKGMEGDILALWHSHGRYYKPSAGGWMWQRPFLFQSVEDTYTMTYVLPFLVPMLENAGAYVLLPRERDTNSGEVIVDNDTNPDGAIYSQPYYKEKDGADKWETGDDEGFIYDLPDFRDTENPFENGTYRQVRARQSGTPSIAAWYADIPKDGEYAVYVSYKSLPNSVPDARYTVNYSGGSREFKVNQKMGGGTWVYLGTFPLEQGFSDTEPIVTLTNRTDVGGEYVVTADAVKIGGGMGNIARSPSRSDVFLDPSCPEEDPNREEIEEIEEETADEDEENLPSDVAESATPRQSAPSVTPSGQQAAPKFKTSGLPRYLEGARYWLHWAGFPENVYSPYHGTDDYKDDYTSRGLWVNYLAGGSRVLPDDEGLGIPVDLVMALHSDAGKRSDDSIIGTLGIYYTAGGQSYADGTRRINSRMLTDMIMRQITSDVRRQWEPRWTRRSMWDKSYVEARVPEVPTALIELLSHQNFADMRYGLDPAFRFTVARSIYKALGRFMAERKRRDFIVQPLPVESFSIRRTSPGLYRLSWSATVDSLEKSARPDRYIILERSGDELGFHKIGETTSTHFDVRTADDEIHSFRVIAANAGGLSFASETLSLREAGGNAQPVLIVNGFTRVSGPESFDDGDRAGFDSAEDFGMPYLRDLGYTGPQTEFRRSAGESFGRSSSSEVAGIIAGNTFDYPKIHGDAIAASGRGFVSSSLKAVEEGKIKMTDYRIVDLILGQQQSTLTGSGHSETRHEVFSPRLRHAIEGYLDKGGRLLFSGSNIVSDPSGPHASPGGGEWVSRHLGIALDTAAYSKAGRIETIPSAAEEGFGVRSYPYSSTLNPDKYIVQHPDPIRPSGELEPKEILRFADTDASAGYLLRKGKRRIAALSIPIESIEDDARREALFAELLKWLDR